MERAMGFRTRTEKVSSFIVEGPQYRMRAASSTTGLHSSRNVNLRELSVDHTS
jgi:hypothetical protein